ncbi:HCP-like protein, partial [Violaceomyces palustris]
SIYQQSNISMPALDGNTGAGSSQVPPLADDIADKFDNMNLLSTPSFGPQRSRTPNPAGTAGAVAGSVRANALQANREIHKTAAEVQPENSLAAIADEVDHAAANFEANDAASLAGSESDQRRLRQNTAPGAPGYGSHVGGDMDGHYAPYNGGDQQGYAGMYPPASQDPQARMNWDAGAMYGGPGVGGGGYPASIASGYPPHHGNGYAFAPTPSYEQNPYFAAAQGYLGFPEGSYPGYPPGVIPPPGGPGLPPGVMPMGGVAPPIARPNGMLARQGTQMSMVSAGSGNAHSRKKSKDAIPQQTLPFNKAFVEEYRQRMKGDPDPEAQFAFAKYLIEAAKKVQDPKDGPKQARKYRDQLLSESLKLVKRLATTGMGLGKPPYAEAQFFLANCFGNGSLGLQVDHEKAYNLYVQASKQNHPAATYRTAVCNEVGAGTRRDHHRAVLFYRKASALGDTAGMYKLGMILLNGLLGQPRNIREAIVWLKRAAGQADEDNPHALHELGLLHEKPNSNIVVHDEAYARELFTQAAQLGYSPSQFKLGSAYEYGSLTCPVDPRRSIAWYTKAAGKGDGESELALSGWYLTGSEGVLKQSDAEAYLWARRAATKGIPKAEYAVGYYSEVGIGVKADLEEAKRWYMRAAAQGNKRAMQRLTELKKMKGQASGKKGARPTRKDAESECVIA